MARLTNLLLITSATAISAFSPATNFARVQTRPAQANVAVKESFGFDFAEDQAENTPSVILGEANYKQWVGEIQDNSFLNRQYNAVRRIRELDLIGKTADYEILSKLENLGLDLATIEELLPKAEELGLLSLVGNNQQLLINGVAPIVIEGAPLLLPLVAGALGVGAPAFFLAAAGTAGLEGFLVTNDVEIPFVGLPAGVVAGLLLVPLTVVFGGVGVFFSGLKK